MGMRGTCEAREPIIIHDHKFVLSQSAGKPADFRLTTVELGKSDTVDLNRGNHVEFGFIDFSRCAHRHANP